MKTKDVEIGGIYGCRVSGNIVKVRVDREHATWNGRTKFDARNLSTNRKIVVSAARLRRNGEVTSAAIKKCGCTVCRHNFQATCRGKRCECCGCCGCCVSSKTVIIHGSGSFDTSEVRERSDPLLEPTKDQIKRMT